MVLFADRSTTIGHISVLFYFVHHVHYFSCLCITMPSASSPHSGKKKPSRKKKSHIHIHIQISNLSILCFSYHCHCSSFIKSPHIHTRFSLLFFFFAFPTSCRTCIASIFLTYYRSRCDLDLPDFVTDASAFFSTVKVYSINNLSASSPTLYFFLVVHSFHFCTFHMHNSNSVLLSRPCTYSCAAERGNGKHPQLEETISRHFHESVSPLLKTRSRCP